MSVLRRSVEPAVHSDIGPRPLPKYSSESIGYSRPTRRERDDALEQQAATSEVLKVISSSSGELQPVFRSMLANVMRICDAKFGIMFEFADGAFRSISSLGVPQQYDEHCRQKRVWGPNTHLGQVARTKKTSIVADARN